ncbi:MAG: CHAT domain-containing protein [Lentisphaeraceae bacterium]|nr:CHAT domain-containing protein [Lentisphaeraceae bacterium]
MKPGSKELLGVVAKESTIKTMDLTSYKYLHFATHGVINGEVPGLLEPALVLAHEENEDGFLTGSEVS